MPQPIPNPETLSSFESDSTRGPPNAPQSQGTSNNTSNSNNNNPNDTADLSSQSQHTQTQTLTKGEAELAAEKLYEERIEDEYAKREGGA